VDGLSLPGRAALLTAILGAGLLVAPEPVWSMLFYLGGLLPFLARAHRRDTWPADAGGVAGVALIAWFTLATVWDQAAGGRAGVHLLWVWNGLNTLAFFLAARAAFGADGEGRERLISVLIGCGVANAVIGLALTLLRGFPDGRMNGWAETRHPILGAAIIAVCVLLAAGRLVQRRGLAVNGAAVLIGLGFIVATGSRGPLIAVAASLALLLAGLRPRLLAALAAAGAAAAGAAVVAVPRLPALLSARLLARGWSSRLDIWRLALHESAARPLLGYGPSARLARAEDNFPHDLFLSTLFYSGAVGLVLLLVLLALAVRGAWRARPAAERWTRLALLLDLLLTGVSDLSQVTKGPGPMWYILWLPVVLALGAPGRRR
jgi:O-antigen ligase